MIPVYSELAEIIFQGAREVEAAVHCLKDPVANKDKIMKACNRVTELEHNADESFYLGVSELFDKEEDPIELIKHNRILEGLERCANEEEDVTDTLKAVLIKMA